MNVFSLLSFSSSVIYLVLGFYSYFNEKKATPARLFFLMTLSLAWWSLCYTFVYPAPSPRHAMFWIQFASLGAYFVPVLLLHFTLLFSHPHKKYSAALLSVLYLPALIFQVKTFFSHITVQGVSPGPLGWIEQIDLQDPWMWVFNIYYAVYLSASIYLLLRWGRASRRKRQKKQAALISMSIILTSLLSFASFIILPALRMPVLPATAPVFFLVMAGGMWWAMLHYRFMSFTPRIAVDEILSHIREFVFISGADGLITTVNDNVTQVLGYTADELRNQELGDILNGWETPLSSRPGQEVLQQELSMQTRGGETIPVQISASWIYDELKLPVGIAAVGYDLRMIRQIQTLKREKELGELKSRFVSTTSRNFQLPIAEIRENALYLYQNYDNLDSPERQRLFANIYQRVHALKSLLSSVLTLEKASLGNFQPSLQSTNLRHFLLSVIDEKSLDSKGHPITLSYELPGDFEMLTDPQLMHTICSQLIDNSIKYSPPGSPIDVRVSQQDKDIRLSFRDSGQGIQAHDLPHVFDFFRRGSNAGDTPGAGMGLSLVRFSLDKLHGSININSFGQKGTGIDIRLPSVAGKTPLKDSGEHQP